MGLLVLFLYDGPDDDNGVGVVVSSLTMMIGHDGPPVSCSVE